MISKTITNPSTADALNNSTAIYRLLLNQKYTPPVLTPGISTD